MSREYCLPRRWTLPIVTESGAWSVNIIDLRILMQKARLRTKGR